MVRGATGPLAKALRVEDTGERKNAGGFQRSLWRQGRLNTRQSGGQHGFASARWAEH